MTDARRRRGYALYATLFIATCITTTWAGATFADPRGVPSIYQVIVGGAGGRQLSDLLVGLSKGLPFSLSLLAILLTHEMGHYVAAKLHGVDASLPLFLPLPFGLIGTLGAVIAMPRSVRDRNSLLDIGAAGPIAGLVVAIPVLLYGIAQSPIQPRGPGMLEGNSLLYLLLKLMIKGRILPGGGVDINLHPVAWAGWVGLLVTMLNLLPIGQLDGGHIAYASQGERHNEASPWLRRGLLLLAVGASGYTTLELHQRAPWATALALGAPAGLSWLIWYALLGGMRRMSGGVYHPPVDEGESLTPWRRRLARAMLVVFVLILTPIPLRPTL